MYTKKYFSEKQFGLDGCEILIPALKPIIENSIESTAIVMFTYVCRKPSWMFTNFAALEAAYLALGKYL